jgi:nucleoside-diphosphate-sugar epimerase
LLERGAHVLIIGGTRYIGRHTLAAALAAGAEVTLLNRGQTPAAWLGDQRPAVRQIHGDRRDPGTLERAFSVSYDAVYDMIAYRAEDVRPLLTTYAGRIGHLVVCSTTSVYAPALYQPLDEAHPRGPHPAWGEYNLGKNAVEDLVAGAQGLRTTVLRPQWVFGPHDYQELAAFYLLRLAAGLPIWLAHAGVAQLNWTYAPDLAGAFLAVSGLPEAAGQAYNVCCDETLTTEGFITLCAQVLGVPADIRHYRPEDLPVELRGQRVGPVRNLPLACSAERLKALCAFRPTPMPEALVRTIDWLRDTGAFDTEPSTPVEEYLNARG